MDLWIHLLHMHELFTLCWYIHTLMHSCHSLTSTVMPWLTQCLLLVKSWLSLVVATGYSNYFMTCIFWNIVMTQWHRIWPWWIDKIAAPLREEFPNGKYNRHHWVTRTGPNRLRSTWGYQHSSLIWVALLNISKSSSLSKIHTDYIGPLICTIVQ